MLTVADSDSADVEPEIVESCPTCNVSPFTDPPSERMTDGPETAHWVAAAAFMSVVEVLSERHRCCLAIDDVQWLDSSSRAAVEFAARRLERPVRSTSSPSAPTPTRAIAAGWLQVNRPDAVARIRVSPMSLGAMHEVISARLGLLISTAHDGPHRRGFRRKPLLRIGTRPRCAITSRAATTPCYPPRWSISSAHRTHRYSPDTQRCTCLPWPASPTRRSNSRAQPPGLPHARVVELLEQPELDGLRQHRR